MIGNALQAEIQDHAYRMKRTHPFFLKVEDGTFPAESVALYLASMKVIIGATERCFHRARIAAGDRGDQPLADYYGTKCEEENGHDQWAEADLESVVRLKGAVRPTAITLSAESLIAFQQEMVDEDPALFLVYTLFTEYLTVLLGPEWLAFMEERCGVPRTSMTVVVNHAELDQQHVVDVIDAIDTLVTDPAKLPRMREVLHRTIAQFETFCTEVMSLETADESSVVARVVSAA